jgi:7TM diverse intracellular signalling
MNQFWHILFLGIAFFQLLFMLVQWFLFGRKEYLFYIGYIFCASLYILFRVHAATGILGFAVHPWLDEWLDQPMAILSYYMYLLFTRHFLSLKNLQPLAYRYSLVIELVFVAFIVGRTISIPFGLSHQVSAYIYMGAVLIMVALVVPMVVLMLKQKNILNNFLVMGSVCYIGGGVAGMLAALLQSGQETGNLSILFGVEIGILAELLLLNTGFVLKNRILQQQVIQGQQKLLDQLMKEKKDRLPE